MKKLNLFLGFLIVFIIFSCSSDDTNETAGIEDPIIGEWKQIRVVDLYNDETFISPSDDCAILNVHVFNSDQTFSYKFYDNEFTDCQLSQESVRGSWSKNNSDYDINFIYRNVATGDEFDGNEYIEYDTREIYIENDTLRFKYTFSPSEITIVEYIK